MVFSCALEQTRYFNVEAENSEQVMDWLSTHDFQDVDNMTKEYADSYGERICSYGDEEPSLKAHFKIVDGKACGISRKRKRSDLSNEEFDRMIAAEFGEEVEEREEETVNDKLTRLQELINESLKLESDVKEKTKELNRETEGLKQERFKKICDQIAELRDTAKGLGCLYVDTGIKAKNEARNYWVRIHINSLYADEVDFYSGKNEYYLNTIYLSNSLQNNKNRVSRNNLDYIMDNWNPEVFEQNFIAAVHKVLSERAAKTDKEYQNAKAKLEEESK